MSFKPLKYRTVPDGYVVEDQPVGMPQVVRYGQSVLNMKTGVLHFARKPTKEVTRCDK